MVEKYVLSKEQKEQVVIALTPVVESTYSAIMYTIEEILTEIPKDKQKFAFDLLLALIARPKKSLGKEYLQRLVAMRIFEVYGETLQSGLLTPQELQDVSGRIKRARGKGLRDMKNKRKIQEASNEVIDSGESSDTITDTAADELLRAKRRKRAAKTSQKPEEKDVNTD